MMQSIIPHLRLLTLPIEELSLISEYFTDEQTSFLTRTMVFGDKNLACQNLNLSTMKRRSSPEATNVPG